MVQNLIHYLHIIQLFNTRQDMRLVESKVSSTIISIITVQFDIQ